MNALCTFATICSKDSTLLCFYYGLSTCLHQMWAAYHNMSKLNPSHYNQRSGLHWKSSRVQLMNAAFLFLKLLQPLCFSHLSEFKWSFRNALFSMKFWASHQSKLVIFCPLNWHLLLTWNLTIFTHSCKNKITKNIWYTIIIKKWNGMEFCWKESRIFLSVYTIKSWH